MAMALNCRDLGIACDRVILAATEEELLRRVSEHALTVHGIDVNQGDMLEQIRALIYETKNA